MEAQNAFITVVLIGTGIAVLIAVVWGFMMQMGGPPADAQSVIKYYDDLFKGEINGRKVNPAAVALGFFIPLLASFSILWALIGILPIFSKNPKPAMVLSLGISFYFTPSMSWILISIFPTMMGVSSIMIGIAVLLASIFVLASTGLYFRNIQRLSTSYPPGAEPKRYAYEREEKKEDKDIKNLKDRADILMKRATSLMGKFNNVKNRKERDLIEEYEDDADSLVHSIDELIDNIDSSKIDRLDQEFLKRDLGRYRKRLVDQIEYFEDLKKTISTEKPPEITGVPTSPTAELELREETLKQKSPEELKKIGDELLKKGKELREKGQTGEAEKLEQKAEQAARIRQSKEAEGTKEEKKKEKKAEITPQQVDLADKTRAELIRSVHLSGQIVDLISKISQPKHKDKITEDSEKEFMEAIHTYASLWQSFNEILLNRERFMEYVKSQGDPYGETLLGSAINQFTNNFNKLKSGREKVKEGLTQLVHLQQRFDKEKDKDAFDRMDQNIRRLNSLLAVVKDEELKVLGENLREAKKSLVNLKEQLNKKTQTKK